MKYQRLEVSPLPNLKFKLLKDLKYKDITVPKGYETNGADVPRIFWSFFPPYRSDYLPAVVVHDYLCDIGEYKKADDYFEAIMIELKIEKSTIFIMTKSVRLFHFLKQVVTS